MVYTYNLKDSKKQSINQLLNILRSNFSTIRDSGQDGRFFYYDTFDWRLYGQGYHLYRLNENLYLLNFKTNQVASTEIPSGQIKEKLQLPSGPLSDKISPMLGLRSLIIRACFQRSLRSFRILNIEKKTIARLNIDQSKIKKETKFITLSPGLEFTSVRGYTKDLRSIIKKFPTDDLSVCREDLLSRGLKELGREPSDYSSKMDIQLTPKMPAVEATKLIYQHLLQIIRINETGIIKDYDTEFVHDYRVAIRRTRSALGQLERARKEEVLQKAKSNFSDLGRSTNKLRDIDVYLLREKQYKQMLPKDMRPHLNPFFENMRIQRKNEYRSLVKTLRSAKYKQMMHNWEEFLKTNYVQEKLLGKKSLAVTDLARLVICKRNRKVLEFGKKILNTSSDDLLHKLRIEGKKLRYLLEFFSSLFPENNMKFLISKLKQLQDNLGDFNDLVIQQSRLKEAAGQMILEGKNLNKTILSLGVLIGKLNESQQRIRKEFAETFRIYSASDVQNIFVDLFSMSGKGNK